MLFRSFQSNRQGDYGLFRQRADGTGATEPLTKAATGLDRHIPLAWSPNGDVLLFMDYAAARSTLQMLTMPDRKTAPWGGVVGAGSTPVMASFSPDGRWVAYSVVEENGWRIYVQPFPATGAKYQIAVNASSPTWSHDGRELFYISIATGTLHMYSVKVTTSPAFTFTSPSSFEVNRLPGDVLAPSYDVLPDGRFIYAASASEGPAQAATNSPMQLVLNWFTELQQRVPVK